MPVRFVEKNVNSVNKRPSVGRWLEHIWLDVYMVTFLGAVALVLYHNANHYEHPYFKQEDNLKPNDWLRSWWFTLFYTLVIPAIVILLSQIFIKSFWDTNNAILGLLSSVAAAWCFAMVLRTLVGAIHKNFTEDHIRNPDAYNVRRSFPGTRSTLAFAGFGFLFLYLNAKLKVWANYRPKLWKLMFLCTPLLFAVTVAVLETLDKKHRFYDCLAGALIGTFFALAVYRMFYASVFDFRSNHIPLSPTAPNISEARNEFQSEYESATIASRRPWDSYQKPRVQSVWTTQYAPQQCTHMQAPQVMGQDGILEHPRKVASPLTGDDGTIERRGSDSGNTSVGSLSVIHERVADGDENV